MFTKQELAILTSIIQCEYEENLNLYIKNNDWNFLKDDLQIFQQILVKLRGLYDN